MNQLFRYAAATAQAALAKGNSIPNLTNIGLGERKHIFDGVTIWTLYDGIKRDDETTVSVFVYDANVSTRMDRKNGMALARNALRKLRALRHPDILRYIDGSETETAVYIVTEQVVPLITRIGREGDIKPGSEAALETGTGDEWRVWGLSKVVSALAFVNDQGKSTHGNLNVNSVFVTPGGEWKLAGFEVLSGMNDATPILYTHATFLPDANKYASPEVKKGGYGVLKDQDVHALDAYQLHLFIQVLFNGPLPFSSSPDTNVARGNIPPNVFPHYRRLFVPNGSPNARLKPATFLALGNAAAPAGFFRTNRLVQLAEGLDSFALSGESEKSALLRSIKDSLAAKSGNNKLPTEFLQWKVLPALIKAFEFGTGAPALLPIILSLGENSTLNATEYDKHILQPIVRAFASPDRAMRMALLDALAQFVERLDQRTVTDKIWPNLLTGFTDVVPVIREATVKSILVLSPKLSDRILNNDLLRLLAKTQTDSEPGIRTNTCILLGRLSKVLSQSTNSKVLIPAFSRAMRDPFVHARMAGLMALMATADCFAKEDLAGRVIPSMSITLVDKEKIVRDQGFKAMDIFVKKLEKMVASMPETALPPADATVNGTSASTGAGLKNTSAAGDSAPGMANSAAGAATALAGWAFTSFAKRLAASDLQTGIGGQSINPSTQNTLQSQHASASVGRPTSTPPVILTPSNNSSPAAPITQTNGMARSHSFNVESHSTEPADAGDWGKDDLMDVNDGGDWDALDPFPSEQQDKVEPEPVENTFDYNSTATLSTQRLSAQAAKTTPPPPKSTKSPMKLASTRPAILQTDDFDNASWDMDANDVPAKSTSVLSTNNQVRGWNDVPDSLFPSTSSKTIAARKSPKPTSRISESQTPINAPDLDNPWATTSAEASTNSWDEFDAADAASVNDGWSTGKPVKPAIRSTSATVTSSGNNTAGKSKVAQMREERKARLAALKSAQTAAAGVPTQPPAAPAPKANGSTFSSGANTAYRF